MSLMGRALSRADRFAGLQGRGSRSARSLGVVYAGRERTSASKARECITHTTEQTISREQSMDWIRRVRAMVAARRR